jgi:negative regulator of sigma-B (phosphoserine phosphatase)
MALTEETVLEHAGLVRPCLGELVSGDAIVVLPLGGGLLAAIVDVLGHGPEAHELTLVIEEHLHANPSPDVSGVMAGLHQQLKGTRGAAVGLCALDAKAGRIAYTGIGNTALRCFGTADTRLVSQDGVLGQNMRTPRVQTLQLEQGDLIVLYTDGVKDRFATSDYPGLFCDPPKEVVRTIVGRFGKDHDDAACLAVRYSA